jgi:hypothetical protein
VEEFTSFLGCWQPSYCDPFVHQRGKLHRQGTQWIVNAQHLHRRDHLAFPHQRVALIILFCLQLGDEPLDMPVERFLSSLGSSKGESWIHWESKAVSMRNGIRYHGADAGVLS